MRRRSRRRRLSSAAFKVDAFLTSTVTGTLAAVVGDGTAAVLCVASTPVVLWLVYSTMQGIETNRLRRHGVDAAP